MKSLNLFFLLCLSVICNAQSEIEWTKGNFMIQFENTSDYQYIFIDTNKVWEIGHPQKNILFLPSNEPHLFRNAIITDTVSNYPNDIKTSFQLRLRFGLDVETYWMMFEHKFDFENSKDGGVIQTSYDNGVTWQNLLLDTLIQNNITRFENFYTSDNTISSFDAQPGFTGTQDTMKLVFLEFNSKPWMINNPILMRFLLASDSQNSSEGWMIDNIRIGGTSYVGNNDKISIDYNLLFPNPTEEILNIKSKFESLKKIGILNSNGVLLKEYVGQSIEQINVSDFPSGIYFILFTSITDEKSISKFVKI